MKGLTNEIIKIGRIETPIFIGDAIIHILELDQIYFLGGENRELIMKSRESRVEFNEWARENNLNNVTYVVTSRKVSKSLLNKWKKFPNVVVTESKSPNGKNTILKYKFT